MMPVDLGGGDGFDLPPEALNDSGLGRSPSLERIDSLDDVFKNPFVHQEPSRAVLQDAPPAWTKFGEIEQEERMSALEQVNLFPDTASQSPPNYYLSSQDDLFEGIDEEMLNALEPDIKEEEDLDLVVDDAITSSEDTLVAKLETEPPQIPLSNTVRVEIPESLLLMPRSHYEPFEPGVLIVKEHMAVDDLFEAAKQAGQHMEDFVEFQLDDFAIYSDRSGYPGEMCSLHHLDTKSGYSDFLFDGKLSVGDMAFFVRRVRIKALPIDNYGTLSKHTVRDKIWVQSAFNSSREIYYRLNRPAKEYRRFFSPFLWVADLAKHFVDYLKVMGESGLDVTIFHFRTTFSSWLAKTHKKAPAFVAWRQQFPSEDFRASVVANLAFLHKEAIGVLGHRETYKHTLWAETWEFRRYEQFPKKEEKKARSKKGRESWGRIESPAESSLDGGTEDQAKPESKNAKDSPPTIVTKYMYECFYHMPFGDRLEAMPLSKSTRTLQNDLIRKRHLELPAPLHNTAKSISTAGTQQIRDIQPGDTISTQRDDEESGSKWRRDISHGFHDVDRWLALVQRVHVDKRGRRSFDVIWYYRPVDTLCALMKYPWNNELFLSDHCSCGETAKIREDEVLGVHDVEFGGTSTTKAEFFCRQTYICAERKWITLEKDHLQCPHTRKAPKVPEYQPGETWLVILDRDSGRSEPCEFVTSYEEDHRDIYRFRRLLRRRQVDPTATNARPNELIYTEHLVEVKKRRILDQCHVRFFKAGQEIPAPYDRDGVGGFFYITHQEITDAEMDTTSYVALEAFPTSLKQGFNPSEPIQRLRGLDLFCGGGNFGRGLEDGGGIEMRWANDFNEKAMHTYMANTSTPGAVSPFLGSIDDLQRLAIDGQFSENVPKIGDVDFISGGSPCPGFSLLTNDKTTITQRKNQSLVAAFGSFIDLYRPRYGLLENVPGIVQRKANRDQDVFSQLICAIVGLGYQTHFFFLDASSCGSPQRRARVFLAFAAPGHRLPRRPHPTHSHPPHTNSFSLGNLPTGEPMVERLMPLATPFKFVSARTATADLPPVYDSKPDICVPYPDHRISLGVTKQLRDKINLIPTQPWGMNFAQAWYGLDRKKAGSGVLTASERLAFPPVTGSSLSRSNPGSNAYGRQNPDRLIETVVTSQSPSDAKNGRTIHWKENRVLTIMEARRAQGFRDHEVLLGLPPDQYRIVGNSVAREVAVSLGAVFREAWAQSLLDERRVKGTEATTAPSEVPVRMGIELSPAVNIEELPFETASTATDAPSRSRTSRSRTGSSRTPSTTTVTPPPISSGPKRRRSSVTVEIRASKTSKTERDDSPSRGTPNAQGRIRPSRLRQSVALDEE
ncbi:dna (cytosine-5-)-methyltransferase [Fusarium albosuccineum]|uniref:DNA (cytosine-5-)-methyltransferase n=1 Tax=Fusarium albosuccineum TaxID=1237068 RepID=A0A8H4LJ78_9HYPO|nr:dna (cytosine-5-)-methyltransferase [Fusarium albosuccineum]